MSGQTMDDLLVRVAELERQAATTAPGPRPPRRHRARRFVLATVALAGLLLIPVGVFANHQFSDVPTGSTFHGNISRAKDAGITAGCSPTTFCPDNPVTRGQMAAFLTRAAGRAAFNGTIGAAVNGTQSVLYSTEIKAGDVTGGEALVVVQAWLNGYVSDNVTGCPCAATFYISDGTSNSILPSVIAVDSLNYTPGSSSYGFGQATVTWTMVVPTGVTREVSVYGQRTDGSKDFVVFGTVVATYYPFTGDGSSAAAGDLDLAGELAPFGD